MSQNNTVELSEVQKKTILKFFHRVKILEKYLEANEVRQEEGQAEINEQKNMLKLLVQVKMHQLYGIFIKTVQDKQEQSNLLQLQDLESFAQIDIVKQYQVISQNKQADIFQEIERQCEAQSIYKSWDMEERDLYIEKISKALINNDYLDFEKYFFDQNILEHYDLRIKLHILDIILIDQGEGIYELYNSYNSDLDEEKKLLNKAIKEREESCKSKLGI